MSSPHFGVGAVALSFQRLVSVSRFYEVVEWRCFIYCFPAVKTSYYRWTSELFDLTVHKKPLISLKLLTLLLFAPFCAVKAIMNLIPTQSIPKRTLLLALPSSDALRSKSRRYHSICGGRCSKFRRPHSNFWRPRWYDFSAVEPCASQPPATTEQGGNSIGNKMP